MYPNYFLDVQKEDMEEVREHIKKAHRANPNKTYDHPTMTGTMRMEFQYKSVRDQLHNRLGRHGISSRKLDGSL